MSQFKDHKQEAKDEALFCPMTTLHDLAISENDR